MSELISDDTTDNTVTLAIGITENLGNYNSLRIDVQQSSKQQPGESLDELYTRVWAKVEAELEAERENVGVKSEND